MQSFSKIIWQFSGLGVAENDSDQERVKKTIMTLTSLIIAFLAIFWGSLYVYVGYPMSGAIPLGYSAVSALSIVFFFITKQFVFFRFSQLALILLLPFLLMWSLGGFANSSVVMLWAFFAPLAALFFADRHQMVLWLSAFVVLTVISGFVDPYVKGQVPLMDPTFNTAFFVMNMAAGFISVYLILMSFVKDREESHRLAVKAREEAIAAHAELEKVNDQLKANEAKIRELMLTDPLTGVANRRHFEDRMKTEFLRVERYKNQLTIAIADIDLFKSINDTYGHDVGDHVIKAFANTLQSNLRQTDFIARIGGEEFVLILPETDIEGTLTLIERMRQELASKTIPGTDRVVTASFGVAAVLPKEDPSNCLKRADKALYESKDKGRNQVNIAS